MPIPLLIAAPVVVALSVKAIVGIVAAGAVGGAAIAGGAAYGIHRHRNRNRDENPETRLRTIRMTSHKRRHEREQAMDRTHERVACASEDVLVQTTATQNSLEAEVKRLTEANSLLQLEVTRLNTLVDGFVKDSVLDKKKIDELVTLLADKTKDLDKTTEAFSASQAKLECAEARLADAIGQIEVLKFSIQETRKELDKANLMIKYYTDKKDESQWVKDQLASYKGRYETASKELQTLTIQFTEAQQKSKEAIQKYQKIIQDLEADKENAATPSSSAPGFFK